MAATGLLDRSTLERMSLVSSSMGRSGNKNPASVIGSPVRALQALRSANAAREAQPCDACSGLRCECPPPVCSDAGAPADPLDQSIVGSLRLTR